MQNVWSQKFQNKTSRTTLALFTSAILVATIFQPPLPSHASTTTPALIKELALFDPALVAVGSKVYFSACTAGAGCELWISDGEVSGTDMVSDIYRGTSSSNPRDLTAFGDWLFFTANDGTTGRELWKTNGTTTVPVADIYPGGAGFNSNPRNLTVVGSTLFFSADDGTNGEELWKSDSTTTTLVRDINEGPGNSEISRIFAFGSAVFFGANDGTNGEELWKSDGETTALLADIWPGVSSYDADEEEWVPPGGEPSGFVAVGSTMFFTANDGTNGEELWKSDGVTATLFRDINPGSSSSSPSSLTALGSTLFFTANDGTTGTELWKSDGVTATLVRDINLSGNSSPTRLTVVNTELYLEAEQPTVREIWKSDGTSSGTKLVTEIETSSMDGLTLVRIGERLLFLTGSRTSNATPSGKLWSLALPSPPSGASSAVPQPATVLETKTKTSGFSGFLPNSSALPVAARKGIKKRIASFEAVNQVVCTGYTSGTRSNSSARALARQRAKAACDVAKRLAPTSEIKIKVSPASGIGPKFRSVRVKITGS
jgi:ELWxxDGT repeat protein